MKDNPFAIALSESETKRIPLLKLGRWVKGATKFAITPADVRAAVANFRKRGADLVVDYEHASMRPELALGEAVPAAGWVKAVDGEADANGVLWGDVEYTAKALELIAAREVRYVSPELVYSAKDKVTGQPQGLTIASVALTNRPFLDVLPALALSEGWTAEAAIERKEQRAMRVVLTDRLAGKARVIMDDNTESVLSVEGLDAPPKVIALSDVARKDGRYDFAGIPRDGVVAGDVVRAILAQGAVDAAVKAGKIAPAQRADFEAIALSDMGRFERIVAGMQTVPMERRGIGGGGEGSGDLAMVDHKLGELTREKQTANPKLSYGEAYRLVLSEHEDLRRRKVELIRSE